MSDITQAIAKALADIPHTNDLCYAPGGCGCDREQRVAVRVAAAIEAAMYQLPQQRVSKANPYIPAAERHRAAALRALTELSP